MQKGKKFALLIIVNFVWMFLLYQGCIQIGEKIGSPLPYQVCTIVYMAAAILLFLIYWIRSHPKEEDAGPAETAKGGGKLLLTWVFPILIIFLLDLFDLYVIQKVRELLSSIR